MGGKCCGGEQEDLSGKRKNVNLVTNAPPPIKQSKSTIGRENDPEWMSIPLEDWITVSIHPHPLEKVHDIGGGYDNDRESNP